jgi:hypothetical protein
MANPGISYIPLTKGAFLQPLPDIIKQNFTGTCLNEPLRRRLSLARALCLFAPIKEPYMSNFRFLIALFIALMTSCQIGFAQDKTILGGRVFASGYVPTQRAAATAGYLNELIAQEGKHRWAASHLPLKVFIDSGAGVPGYRPNFDSIMVSALDEWIKTSQGILSWQRVASAEQANIVITWTSVRTERPEGTEAGLTKTTTRMNPITREGVIAKVNMHIVTQLPGRAFSDADIKKTCLHEIGHALGLQGHSPNAGDIMYYAISPRQKSALTERDRATINDLYSL